MPFHFASSAPSRQLSTSLYVSTKIDFFFSGTNTFHASSAVKLRNGAIQRSMAWVMWCSAVCAERRARLFGAVV